MPTKPHLGARTDLKPVGPVCRTGPDVEPDDKGPARQAGPTGWDLIDHDAETENNGVLGGAASPLGNGGWALFHYDSSCGGHPGPGSPAPDGTGRASSCH